MYLSRVEINSNNRQLMQKINHVGAIHNWVEQCFPDEFVSRVRSRKLWRIDRLDGKEYLLLLSEIMPDLGVLERFGIEGSGECRAYGPLLGKLKKGMRMYFRVSLNPVIALKEEAGERGKLVPLVGIDEQMKFLIKRSAKNGFRIENDSFSVVDRGYVTLKKNGHKQVQLIKATYEGTLEILDAELFKATLVKGMGREKAYGFGLMTVLPE